MSEPCVEHHWDHRFGDNRCIYCQMKYSYWTEVKAAIDRGDTDPLLWQCKPHYHEEAEG